MKTHISTGIFFASVLFSFNSAAQSGSFDTTFSHDGLVYTDIESNSFDQLNGLNLQTDGKVLAYGYYLTGESNVSRVVCRYTSAGEPDLSFGTDGKATFDLRDYREDATITAGHKFLFAGSLPTTGDDYHGSIYQLNEDGSIDTAFGTGGFIYNDISGYTRNYFIKIGETYDGKILAYGATGSLTGPDYDFDLLLSEYLSDGSVAESFGTDGKVIIENDSGAYIPTSMVLQEDHKILIACVSPHDFTSGTMTLFRFNPGGSPDLSFGTEGKVTYGACDAYFNAEIKCQSDGKIILAGYCGYSDPTVDHIIVTRYNTDGTLDSSFGPSDASIYLNDHFNGDAILNLALQNDDKIVLSASGTDEASFILHTDIFRLESNGIPDPAYGDIGWQKISIYPGSQPASLLIQPDGKYLVGFYPGGDFAIARLNPGLAFDNVENHTNSGLRIFPNPATEMINVELTNNSSEYAGFSIENILGETLITGNFNGSQQVDISAFTKGLYFIVVHSDTARYTAKFIK